MNNETHGTSASTVDAMNTHQVAAVEPLPAPPIAGSKRMVTEPNRSPPAPSDPDLLIIESNTDADTAKKKNDALQAK